MLRHSARLQNSPRRIIVADLWAMPVDAARLPDFGMIHVGTTGDMDAPTANSTGARHHDKERDHPR